MALKINHALTICKLLENSHRNSHKQFPTQISNLVYQIQLAMELLHGSVKHRSKTSPLVLQVLNSPGASQLNQIPTYNTDFTLYFHSSKKTSLAAQRISIPKAKLLTNLQIYQWRCQTQFPIVKTIYVNVNENQQNFSQTVELMVFNEYCPVKMSQIHEMSLGQALYMIKESIIGLERLFNRFGGFQVTNSMITINSKGQCRVWLNQNFALNQLTKKDITESRMVAKILAIIQSHSQQSKNIKKAFDYLNNCGTFLSVLKAIDSFVKETKIFVPNRFTMDRNPKDLLKPENHSPDRRNKTYGDLAGLPKGVSYKQQTQYKFNSSIQDQISKRQKYAITPTKIKRFKSQQQMALGNSVLKKSDGDTAYTNTRVAIKTSTAEMHSPKSVNKVEIHQVPSPRRKKPQWIEQSSYIMGEQEPKIVCQELKPKKQLSYSQAVFAHGQLAQIPECDRKYSCKLSMSPGKKNTSTANVPCFVKKSTDSHKMAQCSNQLLVPEEEYEKQMLQQRSSAILKQNGWVPSVSGLMDIPAQLEESFHEGKQETTAQEVKLEKLNKMGGAMKMSILSQEYDNL